MPRLDSARAAAEATAQASNDLGRLLSIVTALLRSTGTTERVPSATRQRLEELAAAVTAELDEARALLGITDVVCTLARGADFDEVHRRICAAATVVAHADGSALLLRRGSELEVVANELPAIGQLKLPVGPRSLAGRVCLRGRPEFHRLATVGDGTRMPSVSRRLMEQMGARAIAAQPIGDHEPDGAAGVLLSFWRAPHDGIAPHTRWLLEVLAGEAAIALERMAHLEQLQAFSATDHLTGLPNRRTFSAALDRELARAGRTGAPLAVAMLDLDRFKRYNDAHGHQAGDALLCSAATSWRAALRRTDLIARWGGEEFMALLPECDLDAAQVLAERLRAAMPAGQTCSVGIAAWDGSEDPAVLIGRADRALYAAKRAGRDRVVVDPG